MNNIISIADSVFAANENANLHLSVQQLHRVSTYIAEMLTASASRRGELEVVGLNDLTQEIFNNNDLGYEEEMAKIVIKMLDGLHIEENQGIMFDVINSYIQEQLMRGSRAEHYYINMMESLVNAIRIKDRVKFYVEPSFNNIFKRACDVVSDGDMCDMSELLFGGKAHAIMNISYNVPKVIEGIENAYYGATMEQFCDPHVDGITKKAFEHYIDGFDKTVKLATASEVEDGSNALRDKLFFQLYINEIVDMMKLVLGR